MTAQSHTVNVGATWKLRRAGLTPELTLPTPRLCGLSHSRAGTGTQGEPAIWSGFWWGEGDRTIRFVDTCGAWLPASQMGAHWE